MEIGSNCVGNGRGLCREGARCASNSDCESRQCILGADGKRSCVNLCGNGVRDQLYEMDLDGQQVQGGEEECDDGNALECGQCNRSCTQQRAGHDCLGGVGCTSNEDCLSRACVKNGADVGACAAVCGNGWTEPGETCDDGNRLACGRCSEDCDVTLAGSDCPVGALCAHDNDCQSGACTLSQGANVGTCSPRCGNRVIEAPELCDDGNTLDCGRCSADCTTPQSTVSGCANGVGCGSNDDCQSGYCGNDRRCAAPQ